MENPWAQTPFTQRDFRAPGYLLHEAACAAIRIGHLYPISAGAERREAVAAINIGSSIDDFVTGEN
ncbi:hypothetical protein RZS08_36395, partial [Arthrospira platensis SPKY1]|nr:hypothetical protein [Arthrospira platensis SPKY1]